MRYQEEITLEVRNEEPDKKRQIATAMRFQTEPKSTLFCGRQESAVIAACPGNPC